MSLEILQKGLTVVKKHANHVDEEALIHNLETASDYEQGISRLDSKQKELFQSLRELGGEGNPSNKRKRPAERKPPKKKEEQKKKVPVFTKKENATLAQRIEILNWHHAQGKPSQKKTAAHFDPIYPNLRIKQPLVSDWLQNEKKWHDWRAEAKEKGRAGKNSSQQKWMCFAYLAGIAPEEQLVLSDGWLAALKRQCSLKEFKRHGEAASANIADITAERARIQQLILYEGYDLWDVFNMDQTGLFWV
ncbi:hypothetical protein DFH08DRAFT_915873 [Mycena albidolilacea]|uniref:Uncharacterized protein n=1 Tax=Mycena albidolilacea TaxID=1033008 RepID=A0AAD6ZT87_9AGAR|nr:hypothetical protein DFH08DRAFT_915873 [Mycena albidolilacea]